MPNIFTNKKVLTVSGCASGIGKTLLCEHIVSMVPGIAAIKVTITDSRRSVTDADEVILTAGKDTCRLKEQGAAHVVWIQSPEDCLPELLRTAASRVPDGSGVVLIEGNSVLGCLTADCSFFVCDDGLQTLASLKKSRHYALAHADAVVINQRGPQTADISRATSLYRSANPGARILTVNLKDRPAVVASIAPIIESLLLPHADH